MVIIIFGAAVLADGAPSPTLIRRVTTAYAFGGLDAIYMATGGRGGGGVTEAEAMRRMLLALGARPNHVVCEDTATDTLSSAVACARSLVSQSLSGDVVYAASSSYHLPRCRLLLRLAGVPARRCPPPAFRPEPYWILREAVALPWDALMMLWRRRRLR